MTPEVLSVNLDIACFLATLLSLGLSENDLGLAAVDPKTQDNVREGEGMMCVQLHPKDVDPFLVAIRHVDDVKPIIETFPKLRTLVPDLEVRFELAMFGFSQTSNPVFLAALLKHKGVPLPEGVEAPDIALFRSEQGTYAMNLLETPEA